MSGLVGLEIDLSHQSTCPIQLFKLLFFCFHYILELSSRFIFGLEVVGFWCEPIEAR